MIAAVGTTWLRAQCVFEGVIDTEMFRVYVKHILVPELEPGDIFI